MFTVDLLIFFRYRYRTVTVPLLYRDRTVSYRSAFPTVQRSSPFSVPHRSAFLTIQRSSPFLNVFHRLLIFLNIKSTLFSYFESQKFDSIDIQSIFLVFFYLI